MPVGGYVPVKAIENPRSKDFPATIVFLSAAPMPPKYLHNSMAWSLFPVELCHPLYSIVA